VTSPFQKKESRVSFASKRPPILTDEKHVDISTDVFGNVTISGYPPMEFITFREFVSGKTPNFTTVNNRYALPVNAFNVSTKVVYDHGGSASKPSSYYNSQTGQTIWGSSSRSGSTAHVCGAALELAKQIAPTNIGDICIARAKSKALSKCANMKMNLAQSFAERKQTANLLVNTVNRFVTFAVLARKGKFAEANKVLRGRDMLLQEHDNPRRFRKNTLRKPSQYEFSGLWLEYSYGWRPLLSDIYGAAELLAQSAMQDRPMSARGTGREEDLEERRRNEQFTAAHAIFHSEASVITEYSFDIETQALDLLKSTGISNPALLAWELVPYSFCVDWILPVGTYLSNWNATHGLRFVKGFQSYKFVQTVESTATRCFDGMSGQASATSKWVYLERKALTGFPSPDLPTFDFGLNLSQVTSAISLLHQLFRR
jgi:hypothetical protein